MALVVGPANASGSAGPSAADLALLLGVETIDEARAEFLIRQATALARTVVDPLPLSAAVVILNIAKRGYVNPEGLTGETIGAYSYSRAPSGLYLDKSDRRTLLTLAGRGGAFSVNPTPANAGAQLNPWDLNVWGPGYGGVLSPDETAMWR